MNNQNYYPVPPNDMTKIAHQVAAIINKDASPAEISKALKRNEKQFTSYIVTVSQSFTSPSQQAVATQNIDGSFGFICKQITEQTIAAAQDTDRYLTSLQLSSQTSLVLGSLPLTILSRLTGVFQPFEMFWPPNSQINVGLQNGSTTATATIKVIFVGFRVPIAFINEVLAAQGKSKI